MISWTLSEEQAVTRGKSSKSLLSQASRQNLKSALITVKAKSKVKPLKDLVTDYTEHYFTSSKWNCPYVLWLELKTGKVKQTKKQETVNRRVSLSVRSLIPEQTFCRPLRILGN